MRWLQQIPRTLLGHWPTPLEQMPRLSLELGGPRIWVKRDDCSGLLTGGNKTRKLEYLIAEALSERADSVITFGAVQSNHARQTAAACAKVGLECHLVLTRRVASHSIDYETNGNVLLNRLCGANTHLTDKNETEATTKKLLARLKNEGKKIYLIPPGGSNATGALGYVQCALELSQQFSDQKIRKPILIHASASAGTQSGLIFGFKSLGLSLKTIGVNVYHDQPDSLKEKIQDLLEQLNLKHRLSNNDLNAKGSINIDHSYLGEGYGIPSRNTIDAIKLTASLEGIAFDPVYSGKALEAVIDQINLGYFGSEQDVVIIHTGGAFSLPVYQDAFANP